MKKYYGIIFSVLYALFFRFLVEIDVLDFNSLDYLIIVPVFLACIPFLLDPKSFVDNSILRTILFPLTASVLFLLVAFIFRLEDMGSLILLLPPYVVISVLVSLVLRVVVSIQVNYNKKSIAKSSLFLLAVPIAFGNIERYFEKKESKFEIFQTIRIDAPVDVVWNNLFSVPNLKNSIDNSVYNYLGFPNPVKSDYNSMTNVRLGYFDNGVILNEKVVECSKYSKLSFDIDVEKSKLDNSQTFKHVFKNENLVFNSITYKLKKLNSSQTELTLLCNYKIRTNVPFYGEFCSKNIIYDFENKLLKALKKKIEE
ncbi:hypothetical protein [Flavobacterium panacagri]|uniref:hypothetical protein n=1 Tax=Flavobacterium panacagri TaxID=3034146 RepID=UPI0025A61540|nr:hypothetical protein [Flavobacterium panacagri]